MITIRMGRSWMMCSARCGWNRWEGPNPSMPWNAARGRDRGSRERPTKPDQSTACGPQRRRGQALRVDSANEHGEDGGDPSVAEGDDVEAADRSPSGPNVPASAPLCGPGQALLDEGVL